MIKKAGLPYHQQEKEETSHVIEYLEKPQVNVLQDTASFDVFAYFNAALYKNEIE